MGGCQALHDQDTGTSADLLNDRVLPFFADQGMGVIRILTDRGTEFCGKAETYDYQLYLALNDIEHTKTKVMHPQTNGICERFHKSILNEFYQVAFRKKIYRSVEELQIDLDECISYYNNDRTHQGKMCCGRMPMETFIDGKEVWLPKHPGRRIWVSNYIAWLPIYRAYAQDLQLLRLRPAHVKSQ